MVKAMERLTVRTITVRGQKCGLRTKVGMKVSENQALEVLSEIESREGLEKWASFGD